MMRDYDNFCLLADGDIAALREDLHRALGSINRALAEATVDFQQLILECRRDEVKEQPIKRAFREAESAAAGVREEMLHGFEDTKQMLEWNKEAVLGYTLDAIASLEEDPN